MVNINIQVRKKTNKKCIAVIFKIVVKFWSGLMGILWKLPAFLQNLPDEKIWLKLQGDSKKIPIFVLYKTIEVKPT